MLDCESFKTEIRILDRFIRFCFSGSVFILCEIIGIVRCSCNLVLLTSKGVNSNRKEDFIVYTWLGRMSFDNRYFGLTIVPWR